MRYDAAPMEGLTDRIWRQVHQQWFGGADRYYAPFLSPPENRIPVKKKMAELAPEANPGAPVIPQLLGKDGSCAAWMIRLLRQMGYGEVNLNVGCPSGTVVGKGRGADIARGALRLLPGLVGVALLVWYFTAAAQFIVTDGQWETVAKIDAQWSDEENILRATFAYLLNFRYPSGDYFPILPWAALMLSGGILGRLIYHTDARYAFARLDGAWNSGFCFLGRHAAVIYVAHMVVIPVLLGAAAFVTSLFV